MARTEGAFIPVRNVRAGTVLLGGDEPGYQPIQKMEGMSIRLVPKVSSVQAQIADLESSAIFVPTMEQLVEQAEMELFVQNQTSMSEARRYQAETAIIASDDDGAGDGLPTTEIDGGAQGQLDQAIDDLDMLANLEEATSWGDGLVIDGNSGQGNALRLAFELSSETELADAYVVASVRVWAEDRLVDLTLFDRIGRVSATPRLVTMVQRDLPTGFEIKEVEIYLFNRGDEIATNLSPKHTRITRVEAQEFIRISYISDHSSSDTPARPDWSLAPQRLLRAADPVDYRHEVEVEIDANGNVSAVKGTEESVVPAEIRALIEEMTFVPAVQKGVPTASVLRINPADYFDPRL